MSIFINGPAETLTCKYCGRDYLSRGKKDPGYCKECERKMKGDTAPISGGDEGFDKVENYVRDAENVANDNSHGYSQARRNGDPDYDCSSLVSNVVQRAGIPVMEKGASYTGDMRDAFLACGFKDVTNQVNLANCAGMVRGDILLEDKTPQHAGDHTAIYVGNGQIVQAGGPDGHPEPGDQTGREIRIMRYYNFPWRVVLRYPHNTQTTDGINPVVNPDILPHEDPTHTNHEDYPYIMRYGDWGKEVLEIQKKLKALGYYKGEADGKFGDQTMAAVMQFQERNRLLMDGEVGPLTKAALDERYDEVEDKVTGVVELGQIVEFLGGKARVSANANFGMSYNPGKVKITAVRLGSKHPYHVSPMQGGSDAYGWVDGSQIKGE